MSAGMWSVLLLSALFMVLAAGCAGPPEGPGFSDNARGNATNGEISSDGYP